MDINLFFLDFETTGLNPYLNDIIEIAIKKYGSDDFYQTL